MGCIPDFTAPIANSSMPNRLLRSHIATAGIFISLALATICSILRADCSIEYELCTRRWIKDGVILIWVFVFKISDSTTKRPAVQYGVVT